MDLDKKFIADKIKNISLIDVEREMNDLVKIGKDAHTIGPRSRIGNNIVDFFTFVQRLETKGKYNTNFFEFIKNIEEFKKKKFIQTMLKYYKEVKNKNNTKNEYIVYHCGGDIDDNPGHLIIKLNLSDGFTWDDNSILYTYPINLYQFIYGVKLKFNFLDNNINSTLFGIGGALPTFAGIVKRAPNWMQKLGLEWLYRLIQEPKRMAKRYFYTNSKFMFLFFPSKL